MRRATDGLQGGGSCVVGHAGEPDLAHFEVGLVVAVLADAPRAL
jgi:hypothetical protein